MVRRRHDGGNWQKERAAAVTAARLLVATGLLWTTVSAGYSPLQLPLSFRTELTWSVGAALALIDPAPDAVEPAAVLPLEAELLGEALGSIVPRTSTREFTSFSRSFSLPTSTNELPVLEGLALALDAVEPVVPVAEPAAVDPAEELAPMIALVSVKLPAAFAALLALPLVPVVPVMLPFAPELKQPVTVTSFLLASGLLPIWPFASWAGD